jgi:hypothetical protein
MALQMLAGPELDAMNAQFEAFEARMRLDGSYDGLHEMAERLTRRFRPDPQRMQAASRMSPCGH